MPTDTNGHILLPKWFLGFLSLVVALLSIAVIPWAASVTQDLDALSNQITTLRIRLDGRVTLQEEVIENINRRMERIERMIDRLEQRRNAGRYSENRETTP